MSGSVQYGEIKKQIIIIIRQQFLSLFMQISIDFKGFLCPNHTKLNTVFAMTTKNTHANYEVY